MSGSHGRLPLRVVFFDLDDTLCDTIGSRPERARKAFNIAAEPAQLRDSYGRSAMGQGCLLARRLVEAGVRFVSVRSNNWDHHQQVFNNLAKDNLPEFDKAFSGLLEDLAQRGKLDTTLVIAATEFGRTPEINVNAGRSGAVRMGPSSPSILVSLVMIMAAFATIVSGRATIRGA